MNEQSIEDTIDITDTTYTVFVPYFGDEALLFEWLRNNMSAGQYKWTDDSSSIVFKHGADAVAFKLRFGL